MRIRRYFGKDAQEAILKVKMELGSEAIILNTRKVRKKGMLGIFAKSMVEVLAAVDEYAEKNESQRERFGADGSKMNELEEKLSSMEGILEKISLQMEQKSGLEKKSKDLDKTNNSYYQVFYRNLIDNDVEECFAKEIMSGIKDKIRQKKDVSENAVILYNRICQILQTPETMQLRKDGKPTVVMFIGPTGVGKTTTLAKIAAKFYLNYRKDVALVTTDTYRIAAVEQLKTYADIIGLPLSVVYSTEEIKEVMDEYSEKDLILIDTAGRSHNNRTQFEELIKWYQAVKPDETYLVLSMTTSNKSLRDAMKNYSFLKNHKLIFTKADESPSMGMILNVKMLSGKKLSYITTGQNVPDDIEVLDTGQITKRLIGSCKK